MFVTRDATAAILDWLNSYESSADLCDEFGRNPRDLVPDLADQPAAERCQYCRYLLGAGVCRHLLVHVFRLSAHFVSLPNAGHNGDDLGDAAGRVPGLAEHWKVGGLSI